MLKENQALKAELRINKDSAKTNENNFINLSNNLRKSSTSLKSNTSLPNISGNESMKGKLEYLKNVLLKYLESVALGNEFQMKILENVIFSVLNVSQNEIELLESKRMRSSFYFSWWYNAKTYISTKIYGASVDDSYMQTTSNHVNNPFKEEKEVDYAETEVTSKNRITLSKFETNNMNNTSNNKHNNKNIADSSSSPKKEDYNRVIGTKSIALSDKSNKLQL
jgi:hypothetical protein